MPELYLNQEHVWMAFTPEKKPFQLRTGRIGWEYHSRAEALAYIQQQTRAERPLYLGLQLWRRLGYLCIDIDRPFTEQEARAYVYRLCETLELYEVYTEFSLNGNLHILFRAEHLPRHASRVAGMLLGESVEIYWDKQAILLTQRLLPFSAPDPTFVSTADWRTLARLIQRPDLIEPDPVPEPEPEPAPETVRPVPTAPVPKTVRNARRRPQRLFLEIVHLFPSFYEPLLRPFLVARLANHQLRLRRPQKHHAHSATVFTDTGIAYNFSTRWDNVPVRTPQRLANFLCAAHGLTPQQLGQQFHQYLAQTSRQHRIALPRRKQRRYFTLHRSLYHLFWLWKLTLNQPATLRTLQTNLEQLLRYQPHRTTLQRGLQTLHALGLVQRTRTRYGYTYKATPASHTLAQSLVPYELGWQFILFHHLLQHCVEHQLNQLDSHTLQPALTLLLLKLARKLHALHYNQTQHTFRTDPPTPPRTPPYLFLSDTLHTPALSPSGYKSRYPPPRPSADGIMPL